MDTISPYVYFKEHKESSILTTRTTCFCSLVCAHIGYFLSVILTICWLAPRFGDMSLPLTLFDLTPHCSCHAEPHICAPFRLLKPFIIFVKMKHSDDAYFECQEHACPICTSCGRSRHSSPPTPSVTPPPLPVSRVHHRSPASAADQNPAAARRRRIDSIGLPAIGSTQRPLATGLTPAITTMALTSARTGTSQVRTSAVTCRVLFSLNQ